MIWKHRSCSDQGCQLKARPQLHCCRMIRYGTKPRSGWIQREQEEVKRLGCGEEGALVEEHNPALYISVLMAAEMASVHEVLCQHRTLMEHLMRGHHPQPAEQGEQLREARRMHSWQSSVLLLASVWPAQQTGCDDREPYSFAGTPDG